MKLYRKDLMINKNLFYILPAIVLDFDEPIYPEHNFAIEFRWLIFHARLLWMAERSE